MERTELLELAFLLWGDETEAEARVAAVRRHRGTDTAVRALLATRTPSIVAAAGADPWWVSPEVVARGRRTAEALAGLPLAPRAAVVLTGLGLAERDELPARFGLPAAVPAVLGSDPAGALADRLAARRPPARDDDEAAADARAGRRRWLRGAGVATAVVALGATAALLPRSTSSPDAAPATTTPVGPTAAVARLASVGPGDTPVTLAAEVAVDAAAASAGVPAGELTGSIVWSGRFDTGVAGVVDAVVVAVVLPDGTEVASTAFAQGRENQTFLVAPCGVQPRTVVTAARCSTADPGTGTATTTVLVTGLTAPATLVTADAIPLATLTPDASGATTARDDAAAASAVQLADDTVVPVTSP
ncbi:hypothetical protein SAMN05660199_02658 [Klenkia soli]|uniref:Uncharacterized protein n=1 Tax=Klenkia soli TaxID=1052260 RepID=A0A1H0MWB7_9ACTN|nr:hypothetical protein [Klenkia soli]SDO84703.1 hypothetical protein SAMN05660199_02658 [Klenkia soli]